MFSSEVTPQSALKKPLSQLLDGLLFLRFLVRIFRISNITLSNTHARDPVDESIHVILLAAPTSQKDTVFLVQELRKPSSKQVVLFNSILLSQSCKRELNLMLLVISSRTDPEAKGADGAWA